MAGPAGEKFHYFQKKFFRKLSLDTGDELPSVELLIAELR
jgi:hypothetical protein